MAKTKASNPGDPVRMTVMNMRYEDYNDFLLSVKEAGMPRADYFKLCYDTAHETFGIIKDKNDLLKRLAGVNEELSRREKKQLHILKHKFGIILSDKESKLDEMIKEIEEPFE